jgi:pimeloyl-ACP methyl ester carboxylesterase
MPFTQVDETTIHYDVKGEGQPIVFIPPPAMGSITFKEQESLSSKFKMITFDYRGHGKSGYVKGQKVSIEMISKDLNRILTDLGETDVILCGYSNGGYNALDYSLRYPENVKAIILCAGFPEVDSFLLRQQFYLGLLISKIGAMNVLGETLGFSHTKDKHFREMISDFIKETNPEIVHDLYKEGLRYKCTDRLHEIEAPILLVDGKNDFYMHKYRKLFQENHIDTDVVYISGVGHQIPTKRSDELNQVIADFVNHVNQEGEMQW